MTTMTKGGATLCKNGTKEIYSAPHGPDKRTMYSYFDIDGKAFSCEGSSLAECREKRNVWLAKNPVDMIRFASNLLNI